MKQIVTLAGLLFGTVALVACGGTTRGPVPTPADGGGDTGAGGWGAGTTQGGGFQGNTTGGGADVGGTTGGAVGGSTGGATGGTTGENPDDFTSPWDDPDDGCGYGTIDGLVCSSNDQAFVNNAKVWVVDENCNGEVTLSETKSDGLGFYTLYGVPNGLQTVHVEGDGWEKTYQVEVKDEKISDITGVAHKECFQAVKPCKAGTVIGNVCHEDGTPFVGAEITLAGIGCTGDNETITQQADANGDYAFPNLAEGPWHVTVAGAGLTLTYSVDVPYGGTADVGALGEELCIQDEQCVTGFEDIPVEGKFVTGMADIILFIDTSGSMKAEAKWVQENVNKFTQYIAAQAVDFRVILIGQGFDLCVPPPLGGPGCTDGPNFRHVKVKIGSNNGLEKVIEAYPHYQDFLRQGASTNFIAVTDDNSDESASWFKQQVAGKNNPGFSQGWVFHSIVGMGDVPLFGCWGAAFGGTVYIDLSDQTGGVKFPICEQDWGPIFDKMATSVVNSVVNACIYPIGDPESAMFAKDIGVAWINNGGQSTPIGQVSGPNDCGGGTGYYFDNVDSPTKIILCKSICDSITGGNIHLEYNCDGK